MYKPDLEWLLFENYLLRMELCLCVCIDNCRAFSLQFSLDELIEGLDEIVSEDCEDCVAGCICILRV
jgi:hypothetical protein